MLSQARRLLRDCCCHPLHFHHHPQPLSALKFKIRAAGATTILHSSLFIIHSLHPALSLAKHIYSALLCKGELLLLSQAQPTIEGLLPPPAPFPPSPPTALCPEIQNPRRRRNHNSSFFIIHYSLFIIHHLSSPPPAATPRFPSHFPPLRPAEYFRPTHIRTCF